MPCLDERIRRTRLDTFSATNAWTLAYRAIEPKDNLRIGASALNADDSIDLFFLAGSNASVTVDTTIGIE